MRVDVPAHGVHDLAVAAQFLSMWTGIIPASGAAKQNLFIGADACARRGWRDEVSASCGSPGAKRDDATGANRSTKLRVRAARRADTWRWADYSSPPLARFHLDTPSAPALLAMSADRSARQFAAAVDRARDIHLIAEGPHGEIAGLLTVVARPTVDSRWADPAEGEIFTSISN
ncbi:MAG: hypothetical protein U1E87_00220 [Alphaproteobacteria bacterium]